MSYTGRCYCSDLEYEFDEPYILSFYAIAESVGIFLEAEQIHRS